MLLGLIDCGRNEQFFDKDRMPARTCIGVKYLPLGAAFEIECIAEVKEVVQ